jgi:hypothetical protein
MQDNLELKWSEEFIAQVADAAETRGFSVVEFVTTLVKNATVQVLAEKAAKDAAQAKQSELEGILG